MTPNLLHFPRFHVAKDVIRYIYDANSVIYNCDGLVSPFGTIIRVLDKWEI